MTTDPWLSPAEVTALHKISKATLSRLRARREGPPFRKIGKAIQYRQSDVNAWVEAQMVRTAS